MGKILSTLFFSILPILANCQLKSGYDIEVSLAGLPDSTVYLAYHLGDKQYIKDTIKLDRTGNGSFRGKEGLPQGIYMVVLPGKKYFEFLVSASQNFSIYSN